MTRNLQATSISLDKLSATLREEFSQLHSIQEEKHSEIRSILPHSLEAMEVKVREHMREANQTFHEILNSHQKALDRSSDVEKTFRQELQDCSTILGDLHERHQMALDRSADVEQKMWKEVAQHAKESDAKLRESAAKFRNELDSLEAKLREELEFWTKEVEGNMSRSKSNVTALIEAVDVKLQEEIATASKDAEVETRRNGQHFQTLVDSVEAKWREELLRCSEDHDMKRERVQIAVQGATEAAVKAEAAMLREEILRISSHNDRLHDENSSRNRTSLDTLDRKVMDALSRTSAENDRKHEEHRLSRQLETEEILTKLRHEIGRLSDMVDLKHAEIRDTQKTGMTSLREEIARFVSEMDGKHEKGYVHTTNSIESLDEKISSEISQRAQEATSEREVRSREVADLCAAVHSVQSWLTEIETVGTQRNETKAREIEAVSSRMSEVKDTLFTIRAGLLKHQEHIDMWQGFQVDKVTSELRKVVQDLAHTAHTQGDKIKDLESLLDTAREAKKEVQRLSTDLAAEVSARSLKDSEAQSRLDKEVHEFSRRVDRLTTATSELGSDLQRTHDSVAMSPSLRMSRTSLHESSSSLRRQSNALNTTDRRGRLVQPGFAHRTSLTSRTTPLMMRNNSITSSLYGADA